MDETHRNSLGEYEKARVDDLKRWISSKRRNITGRKRLHRLTIVIACVIFLGALLLYKYTLNQFSSILTAIIGFAFLIIPLISYPISRSEESIKEAQNELDLLTMSITSIEERAEKQFKLHQIELKKYYDQTLRHSSWIFVIGILAILFGFGIIGISIYLVINLSGSNELENKLIIASLGAIGTILSNYIASIYLKMYSETIKSLTEFHNRLVYTHHLHFGNVLASKVRDDTLRNKTLSEIAINLASHENK